MIETRMTPWLILLIAMISQNVLAQEPSAVVIDLKGEVRLFNSRDVKLRCGSVVCDNDSLILVKNSSLTLIATDGKQYTIDHSIRWMGISKSEALLGSLINRQYQHLEWITHNASRKQNTVRSGSDRSAFVVYPRNTALLHVPDRLVWKFNEKKPERVEVSIRCYENDFSYDEITASESLSLRNIPSLNLGKQYFWFVKGTSSDLSEIPPAVWFKTLSPHEAEKFAQEKQTIASILNQDTLSVSFRMLYANLLISYELFEECRRVLDLLTSAEKQSPMIDTFYAVIFDKMEMSDELQKYLKYTEQRTK